jgi:diguanylate cyclase (GGDEF)-like protein
MAVHSLEMSLELARFQAGHDGLTSLPNRNAVLDAIEQQTRHCGDSAFCVMYIDLDRFKRMNDAYGHSFGDAVLIEVSRRLLLAVRSEDLVARISGDEFVVLVPHLTGEEAEVLALRVSAQVSGLLSLAGHQVEVQLSIGVAQHSAGMNAEDVLTNADVAMYQSKAAGRGNVTCYIPQMRTDMTDRRVLEQEIATGLLRGEFLAYFQPSMNVETGTIRSLEALVRWQHPTRGLLAPKDFVSLAEETGQIIALDHLVLREACRQLKEWTAVSEHLTVSVNLSADHFTDPGLVEHISSTLNEHQLHPSRLWLEITESMVMANDQATLDILTDIHRLGVRFMVDDFGTGYSSLVYLKRYPIDALKIDREFVAGLGVDLEDEAIVASIIRLAEVLGHEVVAEGVETIEQQDWLSACGCNHTQGFLFSQPVHGNAVQALLTAQESPQRNPAI